MWRKRLTCALSVQRAGFKPVGEHCIDEVGSVLGLPTVFAGRNEVFPQDEEPVSLPDHQHRQALVTPWRRGETQTRGRRLLLKPVGLEVGH